MGKVSTRKYKAHLNDGGDVERITIKGQNGTKKYSSQNGLAIWAAKSALNAYAEHTRFGRYQHPDSQPGLHLYASVSDEDVVANIGYVSVAYEGGEYPTPSITDFPLGWAPLQEVAGRVVLGQFNLSATERETNRQVTEGLLPSSERVERGRSRHAWNATFKHDAIDLFMKGVQVEIRTVPIQDVARHVLALWAIEDDEEARQMSANSYFSAIRHRRSMANGSVHARQVATGRAERKVNGDGLHIRVLGGEGQTQDMMKLPKGVYETVDARGTPASKRTFAWNPENSYAVEQFSVYAEDRQLVLEEVKVE
jgi:hypothetical protein